MSEARSVEVSRLIKKATFLSATTAIVIIALKLIAWFLTDSLSLLSSLLDSAMDVIASLLSFVAARYALQPADEDHRFGHGKAEDIAALAQAMFIAGSGVFILIEGIRRIMTPHPIAHEGIGIVVMLISSVLIVLLISYQRYVIRQTSSMIVKADAAHYKTDLLVNGLVLSSLILVNLFELYVIDVLVAIVIALYVGRSAWVIAREAFDKLMDRELSDAERQTILDVVLGQPDIKGVHDLRTRVSGSNTFIQFHLELEGSLSLDKAHAISEQVEVEVKRCFPGAEVLIHADPYTEKEISLTLGRVVPTRR